MWIWVGIYFGRDKFLVFSECIFLYNVATSREEM